MRISSMHFPMSSMSHLPHFVARALLLFCGGNVNCLRGANDQSQRNNGTLPVAQCQIGCDNKTKAKQSKSKSKLKLNSNWIPIPKPNRFPIRNASNLSSLTITLAGTIRLKTKAEAAEAAAAATTTTATLSTTIRSCCPLEALSCRGGQSARRRRLRLCVSVCVCVWECIEQWAV